MPMIAVVEAKNEGLAKNLAGLGLSKKAEIRSYSSLDELGGKEPELLVVSPAAALGTMSVKTSVSCGYALLPGGNPKLLKAVKPECIVSYGMSDKDTISVSGAGANSVMLSVRRELPVMGGGVVEQQELRVDAGDMTNDMVMAVKTAQLILGTQPESL